MMTVVLREIAQDEAAAAAHWYETQKVGLGTQFLQELEQLFTLLAHQPKRFPIILGDTREAPMTRFPYCVYYRHRLDRIVVTAVFHTSRDLTIWQTRG